MGKCRACGEECSNRIHRTAITDQKRKASRGLADTDCQLPNVLHGHAPVGRPTNLTRISP